MTRLPDTRQQELIFQIARPILQSQDLAFLNQSEWRMKILFKAWWELFFPRVPDSKFVLPSEQIRNIIMQIAHGNRNLQIGKYVTASERKAARGRIIGHSFTATPEGFNE